MPVIRDEPRTRQGWRIGDVLDRTDLGALLDELAEPTGRLGPGRRWHCPLPDHDDHRASVSMHRDHHGHERWRCWSGDHRGDAVDLVIATTGRTRADAVDWLATRAGMIPDRALPPIRRKQTPPSAAPARVMDPVVARYANYCATLLDTPTGAPVRAWLHARGITDQTIAANRIGVDPGRSTVTRRRGLPYGAGVAATFPAFDVAGEITYVQSRYLHPDVVGRKYDNPSAALAPHPRLAFPAMTGEHRGGLLAVCEGIPDALIATQAGYTAVALLGAQTPDESVAIRIADHARRHPLDVTLVCDPDPAGRRVADVLAPLLAGRGADPLVVTPPDGLDLNAWALADPGWAASLDTATHPTAHIDNDRDHLVGGSSVSAEVDL
jgi:DNA primase